MQKLKIQGKFPSLNKYTNQNRYNKYAGASLKKKWTDTVSWECKAQNIKPKDKVKLKFIWHEKNRRRDP